MSIRADLADDAAVEAVLGRIRDPGFAASVELRANRVARDREAVAALVTDAITGGNPRNSEPALWRDGRLNGQAWRQLKEELEERAEASGSDLASQELLARQLELCASAEALGASWSEMQIEERRAVIGAVADHFVVSSVMGAQDRAAAQRLCPVWQSSPPS